MASKPAEKQVVTSRSEAAKLLGVTERCLRNWEQTGGFPGSAEERGRGGRYPIGDIQDWRQVAIGKPTVGGQRDAIVAAADIDPASYRKRQENARLWKLEAETGLAKLELEREAGRILDSGDVERFIIRTITTATAMLEEIPDRVDAGLPQDTAADVRELHRRVATDVIREVLGQLAELQQDDDADDEEEDSDV